MRIGNLKQDKGVAGLTILLSLVTMLFVIGLLIMIFTLMGGEIRESIADAETITGLSQASVTVTETATDNVLTACESLIDGSISATSTVNASGDTLASGVLLTSTCGVSVLTTSIQNNTVMNITYSATTSGSAGRVINDTVGGLAGTTDWFDIFIVIGAMVVLILLTVIIITAIRGSGLMTGGAESVGAGAKNVGIA